MKRHKISKEVKDQLIDRIKNQGVNVSQVAQEHGISTNTVYTWLSRKTEGQLGILETVKLRFAKRHIFAYN